MYRYHALFLVQIKFRWSTDHCQINMAWDSLNDLCNTKRTLCHIYSLLFKIQGVVYWTIMQLRMCNICLVLGLFSFTTIASVWYWLLELHGWNWEAHLFQQHKQSFQTWIVHVALLQLYKKLFWWVHCVCIHAIFSAQTCFDLDINTACYKNRSSLTFCITLLNILNVSWAKSQGNLTCVGKAQGSQFNGFLQLM